jgi:hypothetical protein
MKAPKRFSSRPKPKLERVPDGRYDSGIREPHFAAKFGEMASLWPHIEDRMIDILTELLGGYSSIPAHEIFRSIISVQARINVMRALLHRTELNDNKDQIYDEVIDEFNALNTLRNKYVHGLWQTNESGKIFFVEPSIDQKSVFESREMPVSEIEALIDRMNALDERAVLLVDAERDFREARST